MPQLDNVPSHSRLRRRASQGSASEGSLGAMPSVSKAEAITSSLDGIYIPPRTPRTGHAASNGEAIDDVELELLNGHTEYTGYDEPSGTEKKSKHMSAKDQRGMVLLVVLYLIQGVPLGLALGSVPFLLREHLSYSQLGTFALSSYPYSLKLLWSPIVDSIFFRNLGRRKSWIIPMQLIIGTLMYWISSNVQVLLDDPGNHVAALTVVFTTLVLLSATQDIAVDGWALTLLSEENLSYASTCQTIGLNTGYFASFTVFLALNSEAFSEKWGIPHLSLTTYLRFCTFLCYMVTIWLLFKKEDTDTANETEMSVGKVYKIMWSICKLKHVQSLLLVHVFCKIGFQANEAVTNLKLVEKGLGREDLALVVLIDFPCQIVGGWLAAKWSIGNEPLRPWLYAFWVRLGFAALWTIIVWKFPTPPLTTGFFIFLVITNILQGFSNTIQFVGISAFHTRISDPIIGGTYMTLLNTFTNLGGTWPRYFVLKGVDYFSVASCKVKEGGSEVLVKATECVSDHGKALCSDIGGECITEQDGYYYISVICLAIGLALLVLFVTPTVRRLQALPTNKWRVNTS